MARRLSARRDQLFRRVPSAFLGDLFNRASYVHLRMLRTMNHSTSFCTRSALGVFLAGMLICGADVATAWAQNADTTQPYATAGRPIAVGASGGTIDTDGSDDSFSTISGGNMLTITNSNESKGSSLEISGPSDRIAGLTVGGTHTKVVFSGPGATVSGPVIISNRTSSLHFNGDGTDVRGPVANYGKLVFGQTGTTVISGTISGTGQVVQRGIGTTKITGNNTYSGGTLIEQGGTVVVSNNNNLGAPRAPVMLNGGTLQTTGNVQPTPGGVIASQEQPASLSSADQLNAQELNALSDPQHQAPPEPSWTLTAGSLVGKQIIGWGNNSGWHVMWDYKQDWVVPTSVQFYGDFKAAATQALEDLAAQGAPIHGVFYQGNHTLVITGNTP